MTREKIKQLENLLNELRGFIKHDYCANEEREIAYQVYLKNKVNIDFERTTFNCGFDCGIAFLKESLIEKIEKELKSCKNHNEGRSALENVINLIGELKDTAKKLEDDSFEQSKIIKLRNDEISSLEQEKRELVDKTKIFLKTLESWMKEDGDSPMHLFASVQSEAYNLANLISKHSKD